MSSVAELNRRLSALRGAAKPPSVAAALKPEEDEWAARVARLRAAVRLRERSRLSAERVPLPGVCIAPGLLEVTGRFVPFARQGLPTHPRRELAGRLAQLGPAAPPADFAPDWHTEKAVPAACVLGLDTETTGLSGGVGTQVFMLGLVRWEAAGWTTRQLLLTKPSATLAMHSRMLELLPENATLLTYNGKRFDLPLLSAAAVLNGRSDALSQLAHWDLLYPVRRRYRKLWPNCRLATLEHELLGYHRSHDLPGSEAPAAWRGYLQNGHSAPLLGTLEHNREDLISLIEALIRLCERREL